MIIAIDHGNAQMKTVNHIFTSGLADHTTRPPLSDEVIEYQGQFWTLTGCRLPYERDKTRTENFFLLTLFAIAKELATQGNKSPMVQVSLAVGLPPEHFGALKTKFADYFKRGPIQFSYNDKPLTVLVEGVYVYPQAYAAVAPQITHLKASTRTFVVDIGGYTTDMLLLRSGKLDHHFSRSLEMGMIKMSNHVIGKISAQHDMQLDDSHISDVLFGRETILPVPVQDMIRNEVKLYADKLVNTLREHEVDLRSNPVVFIGGGAILLRKYLEQSPLVSRAEFVEDPKANAVGYDMLANAQERRQLAQSGSDAYEAGQ